MHLSHEFFRFAAQKAELSCVPIQDCPYIYNFTKQSSNVEEVFQLLKRSHCGTDGPIHPKVWCAQVRQQNCLSPDGRDGNFGTSNSNDKDRKFILQEYAHPNKNVTQMPLQNGLLLVIPKKTNAVKIIHTSAAL